MKKKFVFGIICVLMVVLAACGKEPDEEIIVGKESAATEEMRDFVEAEEKEFVLGENLKGAITQLALKFDTFDVSTTKEEWYPTVFLSGFCQNSQFTFDYLEELREGNEGILSREQVEFIQYSLTGEQLALTEYVGEEGLDTYQATSGLGYGEIVSYEVNVQDGMAKLTARFEYHGSNPDGEFIRTYNLDVELVENNESCFDGYSIRSLSKEDVTSVEDMSVEVVGDEEAESGLAQLGTETTVDADISYEGEYADCDVDEPMLQIRENEDGTYLIQIGIFRLTQLDRCIGVVNGSQLDFSTTEWGEEMEITGTIIFDGDIATVTLEAPWSDSWFKDVNEYKYYKISDEPNIYE